jgi:NDP-hexose C3-ketoreductase / dTDP-4-oxo-2-deoxy-alpha-D-pentos-2-ene 2,3-reductase
VYVPLGRTGLRVSRIAVGTVNFGGRVEEEQAREVLDHAYAQGLNLVDTADIYGWRVHRGYAEEVVGRWLAADPSRRDQVVIATKAGKPMGSGPNDAGLSARHLVTACEASLRRLGVDCIDLYQLHHVDRTVGWDEIWQALELLIAQGKVRYVGSSNFAGWDLVSAQESARRRGLLGVVAEQCSYDLVTRHAELEVLPAAAALGIGVLVWSPLHGGLLGGVLAKLADGTAVKSAQGRAADGLARHRVALEKYEGFCAELGRHPAEVGLAWVLQQPGVTAVVAGPRTPEHVDGALRALRRPLSPDELAHLGELFPPIGHGGPAPDAWLS